MLLTAMLRPNGWPSAWLYAATHPTRRLVATGRLMGNQKTALRAGMAACPPSWLIVNTRSGSHSAARRRVKRVLAEQADWTHRILSRCRPPAGPARKANSRLIIFPAAPLAQSPNCGWGGILFPGRTMNSSAAALAKVRPRKFSCA